jgi:hypothetical protein
LLRISVSFFFQPQRFLWYSSHQSFGTWPSLNKKKAFLFLKNNAARFGLHRCIVP